MADDMFLAFQKTLDANPKDKATRFAFADWCDENGHDDKAALLRSWTLEKHEEAEKWMIETAEQVGDDRWQFDLKAMIDAGHEILKEGWSVSSPGYDGERLMNSRENRRKFWEHWQMLTGIPVSYEDVLDNNIFSCSC